MSFSAKNFMTILLLAATASLPGDASSQSVSGQHLGALGFRHIGVVGNRIASVSGVTNNPLVYYAGAAAGGLWKTEDGGNFGDRFSTTKILTPSVRWQCLPQTIT